jgi:hypothetical protein
MTRKARVVGVSPASSADQVLHIVGGSHSYRREPCTGCPWRLDQIGSFSAESFRISAHTAYDASIEMFGCHETGANKPAICAGFLLSNSVHNLGARLKGIAGGDDCRSGSALHPSYRAMAVANGVSPEDPVLTTCRADDE